MIEPWNTSKIIYFDDLDGNLKVNDIANDQAYFIPTDLEQLWLITSKKTEA